MALTSTFVGAVSDPANSTTYTFASAALGAASGYRLIGFYVRSATTLKTITSVTIDGVVASSVANVDNGNLARVAFYLAAATANTTGTISIVNSGACTSMEYGLWNIANLASTTATDTQSDLTMTAGVLSVTLNVPAGGGAYGLAFNEAVTAFAWSGISERWDDNPEGTLRSTGAHDDFAAASPTLAVTASVGSGTGSNRVLLAISLPGLSPRMLASLGAGK